MPDPSLGVLLFIPTRYLDQRILGAVVDAGFPITMAQAKLLQRVGPDGTRLSTLAEAAEVTKQSAGWLVDQLEAAGYVERVPDPSDARARLVRLTGHARAAIQVAGAEERAHRGRVGRPPGRRRPRGDAAHPAAAAHDHRPLRVSLGELNQTASRLKNRKQMKDS